MAGNHRKTGITLLKALISALLIYFIVTKIDISKVLAVMSEARPAPLALAFLFFMISKVLSAFRLNLYFHRLQVPLTHSSNLKLYMLGMFYNLFLPGGIGGDAYKGYLLKRTFDVKVKKVVSVLLLDRLSGLLLLVVYACVLAFFLKEAAWASYRFLFALAIVIGIASLWWLHRMFFKEMLPVFWTSFGYSASVQAAQLVSAYFLLEALSIADQMLGYLFVFLVSSIVSVLPLTIGGIGSREVTFLYGAQWLGLDQTASIGLSFLFFLITAVVSLSGMTYHFKKLRLRTYS